MSAQNEYTTLRTLNRGCPVKENCRVDEIFVDANSALMFVEFQANKIAYVSMYRLFDTTKTQILNINMGSDYRIELYNTVVTDSIIYFNVGLYDHVFVRVDRKTGIADNAVLEDDKLPYNSSESWQGYKSYSWDNKLYKAEIVPDDAVVRISCLTTYRSQVAKYVKDNNMCPQTDSLGRKLPTCNDIARRLINTGEAQKLVNFENKK
jgi:hypothetical protein